MPRLENGLSRIVGFFVETFEVLEVDLLVEAVLEAELVAGTVGRTVTVSAAATVAWKQRQHF